MDGELRVQPDLLRDRAVELEWIARALASGVDGLAVDAPGWAAGTGSVALESAVGAGLGAVGGRVAGSAGLLREAASAYEEADDRAAGRLRRVG